MAKLLPKEQSERVKNIVFAKADAHGYLTRGRNENGKFIDALVDDPEVGEVLSSFMGKGKVRTHIKDGILNQYPKAKTKKILNGILPTDTIQKVYSSTTNVIQTESDITVCRSDDGKIFVVSSGNFLKWETALKKALELIAREPNLVVDGNTPEICLQLVVLNYSITDGDKTLITDALNAIGVKAVFLSNGFGGDLNGKNARNNT
ncbi:MAG: hypothetical protein LBS36_09835 [Oscillospiraceae bacterium]|jgi:hypothetical protein|nr:hypothetical protein [Oscillospiraceae bacterium]